MRDERGTTLIETMIAVSMLLVVMAGLMGLVTTATTLTENQGHLGARATEYAVDKMEQLLDLTYGDTQSDTTIFPSVNAGGTGLAVGGNNDTTAPVVGYVDYLDTNGNVLCPCGVTAPANWYYMRAWKVSTPSANLKQIDVTATIRTSIGQAIKASATISAFKTNCPAGC
jgi:pilin/secretion family protein with methylation motif